MTKKKGQRSPPSTNSKVCIYLYLRKKIILIKGDFYSEEDDNENGLELKRINGGHSNIVSGLFLLHFNLI